MTVNITYQNGTLKCINQCNEKKEKYNFPDLVQTMIDEIIPYVLSSLIDT